MSCLFSNFLHIASIFVLQISPAFSESHFDRKEPQPKVRVAAWQSCPSRENDISMETGEIVHWCLHFKCKTVKRFFLRPLSQSHVVLHTATAASTSTSPQVHQGHQQGLPTSDFAKSSFEIQREPCEHCEPTWNLQNVGAYHVPQNGIIYEQRSKNLFHSIILLTVDSNPYNGYLNPSWVV